jgi:LPXTG-motif cell wall-anchored protein
MRVRVGLCATGALALALLSAGPVWAQSAGVSAVDNAFEPAEIEVESGTSVTWTNDGDAPHTATADNGSFDSGNMDPGDDFTETFVDEGRYPYYCEYHGGPNGQGMSGVVVVTGDDDDDGGGGNGEDDTDPIAPVEGNGTTTATDTTGLPNTGTEVDAFIYLALALIAAGAVLIKLGSPLPRRR